MDGDGARLAPLASLDEDFFDFLSDSDEQSESSTDTRRSPAINHRTETETSGNSVFTNNIHVDANVKCIVNTVTSVEGNKLTEQGDDHVDHSITNHRLSPRLDESKLQKQKANQYKISGKRIAREFVQLVDDDDDVSDTVQTDSKCLICELSDYEPSSPVGSMHLCPHKSPKPDRTILRRDKYSVQTKAIARPRSSTPINLATMSDYASLERNLRKGQKLKIILPGDEFLDRQKSPKKSPRKNSAESIWTNFDEASLFSHSRSSVISTSTDTSSPGFLSPKKVIIPTSPSSSSNSWVAFDFDSTKR